MPQLAMIAAGVGPAQFPKSGSLITKTIDLGGEPLPNVAVTAAVVFVDPGDTSVSVVASRSSSDGVTWSEWIEPMADGATLQSPARRYWQLTIALTTNNTAVTPELTSATIGTEIRLEPYYVCSEELIL